MNQEDANQPLPTPPSDDRLIDYLLGESADHVETDRTFSDAAIEQWLASEPANAERLESLATSVLALSLSHERGFLTAALGAAEDAGKKTVEPARSTVTPRDSASSTTPQRVVVVALLATAAAITLAVFWSRDRSGSDELSARRLALAWMETTDATVPAVELEDEWAGEWDPSESDEWLSGDGGDTFAADQDSPPQWLLTAVDQMSLSGDLHDSEPESLQ